MPGEKDPDTDTVKVTGIALKMVDDLIKESETVIDKDDEATAKRQVEQFVQEL